MPFDLAFAKTKQALAIVGESNLPDKDSPIFPPPERNIIRFEDEKPPAVNHWPVAAL